MTVSELIKFLQKQPQDLMVFAHYDGDARTIIDCAYIKEVDYYSEEKGYSVLKMGLVLAEKKDCYNGETIIEETNGPS